MLTGFTIMVYWCLLFLLLYHYTIDNDYNGIIFAAPGFRD